MVAALEMNDVRATARQKPVAGDLATMYAVAAQGRGLIVSDNLAQLQRLHLDDVLDLPTPSGVVRLPIVGVVPDYTDQQGTVFIDRSLFVKFWHDDAASDFRVFVTPGVDPAVVRQRIIDRYAGQRHVFIMTNADARKYVLGTADRWHT